MLTEQIPLFILIVLFGLSFGSFLNSLVWRLYTGKSLKERSECPNCGVKIKWHDNIPIFSFIILGGRCRACREKISLQYPLVEFFTALIFIFVVWQAIGYNFDNLFFAFFTFYPEALLIIFRNLILVFTLLFIFIYDLKYLLIEDVVLLPAALAILILNLFLKISWTNLLWAAAIPVGFFALQFVLTKGKGIGGGDLRIGLLMGIALGWPKVLVALTSAYLIGAPIGVLMVVLRRKRMKSPMPFGPFLAIGTFIALFWGNILLNWYLQFVRFY